MAAIILGMLVSSAKSSYDARKNEVAEMSSEVLTIDRVLAKFGPDANHLRGEFRQTVEFGLYRVWPRGGVIAGRTQAGGSRPGSFRRAGSA